MNAVKQIAQTSPTRPMNWALRLIPGSHTRNIGIEVGGLSQSTSVTEDWL